MPAKTFDEFMALYNPDGTHPVTEIDAPAGAERDTSPFIVIRSGPYTVLVNPLPFGEYLDVDLHSFVDGQDAAAGVLGMTEGRRHSFPPTGLTSAGAPAVGTVIVLVGEQGTEPVTRSLWSGDAVRVTGGRWQGFTGRVEHVNKTGSYKVRLDTTLPGIPGKLVTVQKREAEPLQAS